MSRHPVSLADRRFLRHLPMTLLFQKQTGQPERMFRDLPQLQRLLDARLIATAYDASANAITIMRGPAYSRERRKLLGAMAEELEAEEFLLNPAKGEAA
jgi:hypothetical protein